MARAFKDEAAFSNWERDIKKINNESKESTKESLASWKRKVEEALCIRLKVRLSSPILMGYMQRAKDIIEPHYKKETNPSDVAREIERNFEPTNFGFSHHQADQWKNKDGSNYQLPFAEEKKRRKKNDDLEGTNNIPRETTETTEETPTDNA